MILLKLLTAALLTVMLGLGLATPSHANDKNNGAGGGGIGGTGLTQSTSDMMLNMSNSATIPCDKKLSLGKIVFAQGSAIRYKKDELICENFELTLQKNEYLAAQMQDGAALTISGPAAIAIETKEEGANSQKYSLKLISGKIRLTKTEMNSRATLVKTANSIIEISGLDTEIILKPTTDTKYSTYVRSYSGASWLSLGNKKVAVPMGYMGFSNENAENPIVEVRKDTGQLGSRTPLYAP